MAMINVQPLSQGPISAMRVPQEGRFFDAEKKEKSSPRTVQKAISLGAFDHAIRWCMKTHDRAYFFERLDISWYRNYHESDYHHVNRPTQHTEKCVKCVPGKY